MSSLALGIGYSIYAMSRPPELFDPVGLVQAVDWLSTNADPDDIVVSSLQTGQLIAARGGLRVYLGHPIETLEYKQKSAQVASLFSGDDVAEWLDNPGIKWVFCESASQQYPCQLTHLEKLITVYEHGAVTIFRVLP
jgi:hypothetical protein